MREQLLNRPPAIGDCRRQGVVAIEVRCRWPCERIGRVDWQRSVCPTIRFWRSPKLRRLRCSQCDRLVAEIKPILPPQEAPKLGEQSPAHWTLVTKVGRSSPLWSREHALQFAKSQLDAGSTAERIEGPAGNIGADEIVAWCA